MSRAVRERKEEDVFSNADDLRVGDWISRTQYERVIRTKYHDPIDGYDKIDLESEDGKRSWISASMCARMYGTKSSRDVKLSRTKIAELLIDKARDTVFEVCFRKKPTPEGVATALASAGDVSTMSTRDRKALAKRLLDGEACTIIGHQCGTDTNGRVRVIALKDNGSDIAAGANRFRLVDPRTIEYLVLRGTKHSV